MIEGEAARNYLLDYRMCGDLGPMRIISINFVVSEEDAKRTEEWLREKILRNEREFTLGEFGLGPFKAEMPPEKSVERIELSSDGSAGTEVWQGSPTGLVVRE